MIPCPCCHHIAWRSIFSYDAPPVGETHFQLPEGISYYREVSQCTRCGHFVSHHTLPLHDLYQGDYVDATYGDKLAQTYDKIMALPPEKSDNRARVEHVHCFALSLFKKPATVLDVGSGLCVFLAGMKEKGWDCFALDPDPRAALHAQTKVQVQAVHTDFEHFSSSQKFHLISFNKVLEHVVDPASFLTKTKQHLAPQGLVYVELPDGESAVHAGAEREEFFIDHHHVFSLASLSLLAHKTNYKIVQLTRLQEPSTKYTLRAFLSEQTV